MKMTITLIFVVVYGNIQYDFVTQEYLSLKILILFFLDAWRLSALIFLGFSTNSSMAVCSVFYVRIFDFCSFWYFSQKNMKFLKMF